MERDERGGGPPNGGVVVVGSINLDSMIELARRPSPGETVIARNLSQSPGGKGANQAAAAARLRAQVTLLARVGDDAVGSTLLDALAAAGVVTTPVLRTPSRPSGAAIITVTPDGENSIIVVPGANADLGPDDLEAAATLLRTAAVLLLQLEIAEETVDAALELAGEQTLVVLNAAPYRPLSSSALGRVDVLVLNEHEARSLLGPLADLESAASFRVGPRATVITLGGNGARAFVEDECVEVRVPHVEVVDTTGAGDAFVGALGAWFAAEGLSRSDLAPRALETALAAAVVAATSSVQRRGAQPSYATREELGKPWS